MTDSDTTSAPFETLERYIAIPRIEGLALSPDSETVVLTIATLTRDRTGYVRSLWAVPAHGGGTPRRLTRSAKGEGGARFTSAGDILFVSGRPDADSDDDEKAQLWMLPAAGGEARAITRLAGGVDGVAAVADHAARIVIEHGMLPSSDTLEQDAASRADREKRKVAAILHETYPVRFWDHDLGPEQPHLAALDLDGILDRIGAIEADEPLDANASAITGPSGDASGGATGEPTPYPAELPRPRDLTPHPATAESPQGVAITPDGRTVIAALGVQEGRRGRTRLVAIDVESGAHTVILDRPGAYAFAPVISPDGARVAFVLEPDSTADAPADEELWVAALDGSDAHRVAVDWDRWVTGAAWSPDAASLIVTADDDGRGPVFRLTLGDEPESARPERLTSDDASYTSLQIDRASGEIVALRSSWVRPPHPVHIALDGTVTELATPTPDARAAGTITEVETTAADGARVRAWLMLPEGASAAAPAPLLLWIHGGPLNSWNAWSWRWSPSLAVARGYAVLLPDPALSTGYGLDFIARGWNDWGGAPFTDLMSVVDATVARDDIDETRTAAMGGSFGGYMANWVAGHTDRFRAIVTHASLWNLEQFNGTTDHSEYWQQIFTSEGMRRNSPHQAVADIRTPMLVIHGDRDYRVPIGEGLALWSALAEHHADADGRMPHKFLYFPDENHWVLKPQHAVVWYDTVFAFLAQHVLGGEWERPAHLG